MEGDGERGDRGRRDREWTVEVGETEEETPRIIDRLEAITAIRSDAYLPAWHLGHGCSVGFPSVFPLP